MRPGARAAARLLAAALVLLAMASAAPPATATAAEPDRPVVLLAGAEAEGGRNVDCGELWASFTEQLKRLKVPSGGPEPRPFEGRVHKLSLFRGDANCEPLGDGDDLGVAGQARLLSDWLRARYGAGGTPVDIIASGTSGLVVKHALGSAQLEGGEHGPPLRVEDVVTIGTPYLGAPQLAEVCPGRRICREMDPSAPGGAKVFHDLVRPELLHPQSPGGTDWTLIASDADELVPVPSALGSLAAHTAQYDSPDLSHDELLSAGSAKQTARVALTDLSEAPRARIAATGGATTSNKGLHVVARAIRSLFTGLGRQRDVLTTQRLRSLVRAQSWGQPLAGVTFNRGAGRSFQELVLRILNLRENVIALPSPRRASKTLDRVRTVIPDALEPLKGLIVPPSGPPRLGFHPASSLYEVKAESQPLRAARRDHQLLGLIDAAGRSPAVTAPGRDRAVPVLTLVLTDPSTPSAPQELFRDDLFDEAYRAKVAIWFSVPYVVPENDARPGTSIGLMPFVLANPEVYGRRLSFAPAREYPGQTQLLPPGAPAPGCDPDPPQVDSLELPAVLC